MENEKRRLILLPLQEVTQQGKPGYRWGDSGHIYSYEAGDEEGRKKAKRASILQGVAIEGGNIDLAKDDLDELKKDLIDNGQEVEIVIKDNSNQCLFGWAYARTTKDGEQLIDHSGEFVKAENFESLELAVYAYNLTSREADTQHDMVAKGYLIESVVFTKEKMKVMGIPEGTVPEAIWMGYWFPDEKVWKQILQMPNPMFSIYGSAKKEIIIEEE
jgi:hypothetical protein